MLEELCFLMASNVRSHIQRKYVEANEK